VTAIFGENHLALTLANSGRSPCMGIAGSQASGTRRGAGTAQRLPGSGRIVQTAEAVQNHWLITGAALQS
jgi:hypothetical protein